MIYVQVDIVSSHQILFSAPHGYIFKFAFAMNQINILPSSFLLLNKQIERCVLIVSNNNMGKGGKILHFGFNKTSQLFTADYVHLRSKGVGIENHLRNIAMQEEVVSLATPQVGDFWKAFILLKKHLLIPGKWTHYKNLKHTSYDAFLNPNISDYSQEEVQDWEECCGYPGLKMMIKRSIKIKVTYDREKKFDEMSEELSDFQARLFQHEFDHLEGKDPLKLATKLQIIDPKLQKQHNQSIQTLFQQVLNQRAKKNNQQPDHKTQTQQLYHRNRPFNQLRREITYCITDHYRH